MSGIIILAELKTEYLCYEMMINFYRRDRLLDMTKRRNFVSHMEKEKKNQRFETIEIFVFLIMWKAGKTENIVNSVAENRKIRSSWFE